MQLILIAQRKVMLQMFSPHEMNINQRQRNDENLRQSNDTFPVVCLWYPQNQCVRLVCERERCTWHCWARTTELHAMSLVVFWTLNKSRLSSAQTSPRKTRGTNTFAFILNFTMHTLYDRLFTKTNKEDIMVLECPGYLAKIRYCLTPVPIRSPLTEPMP